MCRYLLGHKSFIIAHANNSIIYGPVWSVELECTLPTYNMISLKMTTLQGVRIVLLLTPCILSASVNVEKLVHHFHMDKILESLQQRNPQLQPEKVLRSLIGLPAPAWTWRWHRYLLQEDPRREASTIPQCQQQGIQDCWPVTFNIANLGEGQTIMLIEGSDIELKVSNNYT